MALDLGVILGRGDRGLGFAPAAVLRAQELRLGGGGHPAGVMYAVGVMVMHDIIIIILYWGPPCRGHVCSRGYGYAGHHHHHPVLGATLQGTQCEG